MTRQLPESWCGSESIDWVQACEEGELIARGPLNDTYRVELDGTPYIVRHRPKHVGAYGQTFAGERHLPDHLRRLLRVPDLLKVAPDSHGRDAFAIFELIETSSTRNGIDPAELLEILTTIHEVQGPAMGDLGRPLQRVAADVFLSRLIQDELRRVKAARLAGEIRKAEQRILRAMECFKGEPPCLCHGDVHAGNFLRRQDGQISVIDWEAVRFRVAAADFNQLHRWLPPAADLATLRAYAEQRGRDFDLFARQVVILRFLWHLRTFNFYVLVQRESFAQHARHLDAALALAQDV